MCYSYVIHITITKRLHFSVDDGTGVISCACWKPHEVNFNSPALEELPWQLVEKLQQVSRQQEASRSSFGLGELLHVRGKIKIYQDKKELACSYHGKFFSYKTWQNRFGNFKV